MKRLEGTVRDVHTGLGTTSVLNRHAKKQENTAHRSRIINQQKQPRVNSDVRINKDI